MKYDISKFILLFMCEIYLFNLNGNICGSIYFVYEFFIFIKKSIYRSTENVRIKKG